VKKNFVFLAGLLFLIAVEVYIVIDNRGSRRPSPAAPTTAGAPRPAP
jgi:hypothetical protein